MKERGGGVLSYSRLVQWCEQVGGQELEMQERKESDALEVLFFQSQAHPEEPAQSQEDSRTGQRIFGASAQRLEKIDSL